MIDLAPFIDAIPPLLARHALDRPGAYQRYTRPGRDDRGNPRAFDCNAYGCADAANLLYTLGRLPGGAERAGWIETLHSLQDPVSGEFREPSHHALHTTAHCLGALELFDARPRHRLASLDSLRSVDALEDFLEALDWRDAPWTEAHRGAGLYAALCLADELEPRWADAYFAWLARHVDAETGLLRRGCVDPSPEGGVFPHLAGSFHYLFNFEHARRPWPAPEALIDTCLAIRAAKTFPLARHVWFADVDWAYCLSRMMRQTAHRFAEAQDALASHGEEYARFLLSLDPERDEGLDDLHRLFGALCAAAELQQAVRGLISSPRPLRLVLDRRPFI